VAHADDALVRESKGPGSHCFRMDK
jgi:hypothetical protein